MSNKVCGNYMYNTYDAKDKMFYCDCTNSDNYGCGTFYDGTCEDWEGKYV